MKRISCENAAIHNGMPVTWCELKGERPSWVPRGVWVMAHKFIDLGGVNVKFKGCDGQMWRADVN